MTIKQTVQLLSARRWLFCGIALLHLSVQAQTPFSQDSAAGYLKRIAVEIGPRTTGSPNEQRAMEYAVQKFREFGLAEAYVMRMNEFVDRSTGGMTNTRSGAAVGVLPGKTDRIIVLGAHIDSREPEIPGANDDGSGCAVVIELARTLAQRSNASTFVFALFGGEERGLRGSRFFAENFPRMDQVVLMLQIDMANGSDWLMPLVDAQTQSAPQWLVEASYEEIRRLGYSGYSFPTHFFTLMGAMPGGGIGSDHEPFLDRNIPAICFTSDPADPIHTQQDNFENFIPGGLKRSGDLVYRLVERFDESIPEQKAGKYFLYEVGNLPLFIPLWALRIFILISVIVAVAALVRLRQRHLVIDRSDRPKVPGLKLFLLMLIIQTCVWFSENIVSLIKGVRRPWMASLDGYFVLAFFAACFGIWIALQLAPKLHLRKDAYSYFLRSGIFLLVILALFALISSKLALYPALALFFLGLALMVRHSLLKLMLWLLSPYFMYRLFFSEGFEFLARAMGSSTDIPQSLSLGLQIIYILFFSIWAFPFLLGFAAVYFDSQRDLLQLKKFRGKWGLIGTGVACVLVIIYLSTQPSYTATWRPNIKIEQSFDSDSAEGRMVVRGSEYLAGTRLRFGSMDTLIESNSTQFAFSGLDAPPQSWISVNRTVEVSEADSSTTFKMLVTLHTRYRPFTLRLSYSGGKNHLKDVSVPVASSSSDNTVSLQWYSFADTLLLVPIQFTVVGGESVVERVEAKFIEEAVPIALQDRLGANVARRTVVSKQSVIKGES